MSDHIFTRFGGTRFLLALGCSGINTLLLMAAYINQQTYKEIILGTVGAYILGNTIQNSITMRPKLKDKNQESTSEY